MFLRLLICVGIELACARGRVWSPIPCFLSHTGYYNVFVFCPPNHLLKVPRVSNSATCRGQGTLQINEPCSQGGEGAVGTGVCRNTWSRPPAGFCLSGSGCWLGSGFLDKIFSFVSVGNCILNDDFNLIISTRKVGMNVDHWPLCHFQPL